MFDPEDDWENEGGGIVFESYGDTWAVPLETDHFKQVKDWHHKFGVSGASKPTLHGPLVQQLRYDLIEEELKELQDAFDAHDIVAVADALGDLLYVVYGAAEVFGIPIHEVFNEIQRSNMSKLGEDGKPIWRDDGKILKGPNYSPPDLETILKEANGEK